MNFNSQRWSKEMIAMFTRQRKLSNLAGLLLTIVCAGCAGSLTGPVDTPQASLRDYAARIPIMRAEMSKVMAGAQASATRIMEQPTALLNVPYWEQPGVGEELVNRSGGLANVLPTSDRTTDATDRDVVLLSVRSWENDGTNVVQWLKTYRAKKWYTTLIASRAGCPPNLKADCFIDNGAPSGGKEHGRINVLANTTLAWMWCCEYVSAMTRQGKMPGVLMSVGLPEGEAFDHPLQTRLGRHWIGSCTTATPAGAMAETYLQRVEKLVADLRSGPRQMQIKRAADIVAQRMAAGQTVGLSGVGHLILFETQLDNKAPWKGFSGMLVQGRRLKSLLKPGDLLVWIGYSGGVNSKYFNFAKAIHNAELEVITCFTPDPRGPVDDDGITPLAHIDQSWAIGDAEVPLPLPPGKMAPISGLNQVLIQRMLDDEVTNRLVAEKKHN